MDAITQKSDFLADARARIGLTQKEFASLLRTTAHMISQYETGRRQPSKRVLAQVQRVLIERNMTDEPCCPIESDLLKMYRNLSSELQEQIVEIMHIFSLVAGIKPKNKVMKR